MKKVITKQRKLSLMLILLLSLWSVDVKADQLWVGQSKVCNPSFLGIFQTNVSWSVTNSSVVLTGPTYQKTATVDNYFSGSAVVTCTYQYKYYANDNLHTDTKTWTITCIDNPLTILPTQMTLEEGESAVINKMLQYTNQYNSYAQYTFSSTDPSVATVNYNGNVTAVGPGIANILVFCNLSSNSCHCVVNVACAPIGVSIPSNLSVGLGDTYTITPTLYPDEANTTYTWHSSDPTVATVSSSGVINAIGLGTTTIKCTTHNDITSNECLVTVDYKTPTQIDIFKDTCFLMLGDTCTLQYAIYPANSNPEVSWHSCDESIAPVYHTGLVAGANYGTTAVVVRTANGLTDTCYVSVRQPAEEIKIRETLSLAKGVKYHYNVTSMPENSYANNLKWESEDNSIATVSNGVVTGVNLGGTKIYVYNDEGLYAECNVYVKELNHVNVWLESGEMYSFPIIYEPRLKFVSDDMINITAWYFNSTFKLEEINRITIADEEEPSPIIPEEPEEPDGVFDKDYNEENIFISCNIINVSKSRPFSDIKIYNMLGKQIDYSKTDAEGNAKISTDNYNTGIYIININNKSFKILVP